MINNLMCRVFFLLLVISWFSCCSKKEQTRATIDWRGGSRIENIDWKFNGKPIGHGEQGFTMLLKQLDELDDGASLKVHYPLSLWNTTLPDYELSDPFPFLGRDDLRKKFNAIFSKKRMTLQEFSES